MFAAAPALAAPYVALPSGWINFDGNGSFDQTIPGTSDATGPLPIPVGAELFGVGTISGAALMSDLGDPVWLPADIGPNYEMTFSFWDAVVVASGRSIRPDPNPTHAGQILIDLWAVYSDEARVAMISDTTKDFTGAPGPGSFNTVTGYYPTANELPLGTDAGESLYLDLLLYDNSSLISWSSWAAVNDPASFGFLGGSFTGFFLEINGGYGATSFMDGLGYDGSADAFIINFSPLGWAYGADTDIQLQAVPEPAALMSLCAGLALLGGYKIRKRS
jgi:hypothetical protein